MAWRLSLTSGADSSTQAPLAKRRNVGPDAGGEGEDDHQGAGLRSMMLNLQKLSLHQQQTLKSVCSSAWTTYKVQNSSDCVVGAREAGQAYAAAVAKKRTNHGLGSPHTHVAMPSVEGLVAMGEAAQLQEERDVLQVLLDELTARGPLAVDDLFPYFKVVDLSKGGSGRKRREGGDDAPKISLLQFQMSPFATVELTGVNLGSVQLRLVAIRGAIDRILTKAGAEKCSGAGPPMALERLVQKDVDSLQRRK